MGSSKKNIEKYEDITSEEINAKAKELFGENLKKQISEKGNTSFEYNEEEQKYNAKTGKVEIAKN